ncbi:MAG: prolipoprotein diacylglyceryl transferase [Patescibacteria group bacterium]
MFQSPGQIAIQIGSLQIHWYGILIGVGIVLCYLYVLAEAKRRKVDVKHIDNMAFWMVLCGVIGARLYFVLFNLPHFMANPLESFMMWKGGLAIHGALIGGAIPFFIYILRHKIPWLLYADIIMPGILFAQALGRWGNFFNNEAFGAPTELPWKLFIPPYARPEDLAGYSYFHPTFLYESLWNFIGVLILITLTRKIFHANSTKPAGIIFCAYLIWYGAGRFFIESLRMDSLYLGSFKAAQAVSFLMFFGGVIGLIFWVRKHSVKTH